MDSNFEIGAACEALTPIAWVLPQTDFERALNVMTSFELVPAQIPLADQKSCDIPLRVVSQNPFGSDADARGLELLVTRVSDAARDNLGGQPSCVAHIPTASQFDFGGLATDDTLAGSATEPHCDAPEMSCLPFVRCASQTPSTAPLYLSDPINQCADGSTPTGLPRAEIHDGSANRRGGRRKVAARPPAEPAAVVAEIVMHYRRYEDLRRAYQRIELQAIATCRAICGGDKTAGMKLYKAADNADAELWLTPYRMAMAPLTDAIKAQEKMLAALARELPVYEWAQAVAGLSDRFLAMIVGAAGRPITDYRNPSCLWKRMGMAVIDGERQRRVTGDAALVHGYNAGRRALMWNIEESILKQQLRKDEEATRIANGYYGQVYIDRRAHEVANKGEKYSHHRAKRYVGKRLLRELWRAWRDGKGGAA